MKRLAAALAATLSLAPAYAQTVPGRADIGIRGSGSSRQMTIRDAPGGQDIPFAGVDATGHRARALPSFRDVYPTHAALLAAIETGVITGAPRTVSQQGYTTSGDGGAAFYDWNATSTATADGIFVLAPTDGVGRFMLRVPGEGVHPEVAGAAGYGLSAAWDSNGQPVGGYAPPDDSAAFNTLSAYLAQRGGGTILPLPEKFYDLHQNTLMQRHVGLRCAGSPLTQTGGITSVFLGGITHPGSAQLQLSAGALLENCSVLSTGIAQKPTSTFALFAALNTWSGQGVTILGDDARITGNMVVGFGTAISGVGYARPIIERNTFDSLNGIFLDNVHDAPRVDLNHGNNTWAFNLNGHVYVVAATIASGGSGYTNGTQTLTVAGGNGTPAQLQVTVSGGVVTAITGLPAVGDYTSNTTYPMGVPTSPVSVTGGGGSGATFTLYYQSAVFRPGVGYQFGSDTGGSEGGYATGDDAIGWAQQFKVNNWFGLHLISPMMEGDYFGSNRTTAGLVTANCASNITIISPYISSDYTPASLKHASLANGGNCPVGITNTDASVSIFGGVIGNPGSGFATNELIELGSYSTGRIIGTHVGGPGGIVTDPNVGPWKIDIDPSAGYTVAGLLHPSDAAAQANLDVPQSTPIGHTTAAVSSQLATATVTTGGSILGNDYVGEILEPTGATGAILTFKAPFASPSAHCVVSPMVNPVALTVTDTTTQLSVTHAATSAPLRFSYVCR